MRRGSRACRKCEVRFPDTCANLLNATVITRDGKPITDMNLNVIEKTVLKQILEKLEHTDIAMLLRVWHS